MNTHIIGAYPPDYPAEQFLAALSSGGGIFLDPVGDAADTILRHCPKREVLVIDPTDLERPVGFNVLYDVRNKPLLTSLILSTVKAIWNYDGMATPVLDRFLYNSLACLLEYPGATLLDIDRILTDTEFRDTVLERVSDPYLKRKWAYWDALKKQDYDRLIQSTENKAGEFSEDPRIRAIIGQAETTFDLRQLIAERAVIILKLPVSQLGQKTSLFGSLFLAYLLSVQGRVFPFHIFIDGVHHFDTPIVRYLMESRFDVTVAHRYFGQLSDELKVALLGSADRREVFRTGVEDSAFLERTMAADNNRPKPHDLDPDQILTIAGSKIEWDRRYSPINRGNKRRLEKILSQSKRRYGGKDG